MSRIAAAIVVGLCLLVVVVPAHAEDRALLVGIGQYRISAISLPGIDTDIRLMRDAVSQMGFKDRQVKVLTHSQATLAGIEHAIETWLIDGVTNRDRVLLYYTGHGSQVRDTNSDEADGADEVLCPHDIRVENRQLSGALLDDRIGQLLARVPAKQITVFIDACHSGTATKDFVMAGQNAAYKFFWYEGIPVTKSSFTIESDKGMGNLISLAASHDDEKAIATRKGSLFTRGVCAAVASAVRQGRPLTLEQLQASAKDFIRAHVKGNKKPHRPQLTGNLALAKQNVIMASAQPSSRPSTPTSASTHHPKPTRLWTQLESLADRAQQRLIIKANSKQFRVGQELTITCQASRSGYLNILSLTPGDSRATVLYPNRLHPDNQVRAGETVTIPGPGDSFVLRARPPLGKTLVVVFLTQRPVNAYQQGQGKAADMFKTLTHASYRGFAVEEQKQSTQPGSFAAGKFVAMVE